MILEKTLPPSIMTLVFSQENNLDENYITNLLSISLPFSLVFLALLMGFL